MEDERIRQEGKGRRKDRKEVLERIKKGNKRQERMEECET